MQITIDIKNQKLYLTLLRVFKSMGIQAQEEEKAKTGKHLPLKNSVIRYIDPFGSASEYTDWDVNK